MIRKHKLGKLAVLGTALACATFVLAVGTSSFASPAKTAKTHMVRIPGGTLTIAEAAAGGPNYIFPMMPGQYFSVSNFQLIYLMWRPLYWFGLGNTPALNTKLSLADLPVFSDGGRVVTISLKNYEWSNGQPVTAQDVVFWMNLLKADVTSWGGFAPGPGQFPGDVTNVVATNSKTVTLTLDATYSSYWFLYNELSQISPLPLAWDINAAGGAPGSGGCSGASYKSITTAFGSSGLEDTSATAKACAAVYAYLTSSTNAGDLGTYATNPLWQIVDGPFHLTAYDATDNGATVVPNPKYSGPVKSSLTALVMAPFTTDASEFSVLQGGSTLNIGYVPPQDLPRYTGAAFDKNGNPLAGKNNASLASHYNLDPVYPWGVNYFAMNYTNTTGQAAIFKQLYFRQALQSLMNQSLWIQLYNAGYGAPTYGPVPVYPPTDFVSKKETQNLYPYSPTHAVYLLQSHGWKVVPGGTSYCAKPGVGPTECGYGIAKGTKLSFSYLYYNGAVSFNSQIKEMASSWEQAGVNLTLEGKDFGDVIGTAFTPCAAKKPCTWDFANWGGGWIYSPDFYPTGEEIWETGAGSNAGAYSNPTANELIKLTDTSNSLNALYNYQNYLAQQLPVIWQPETALEFNEVGKNVCGFTPQNPLFSWEAENWYFCKAS